MLTTTMNGMPGTAVDELLGEIFGLTVRWRRIGPQIGASFASNVGGELTGLVTMRTEGSAGGH